MGGFRASRGAAAALMVAVICTPTLALAQDDDWEFAADPTRNLTVAAVRYSDGKSIVAQCAGRNLKLVLVGLPGTTEPTRVFDASFVGGRTDVQVWRVGADGALTSEVPARDLRFLAAGGALQLRSASDQTAPLRATFDLPTQHANLHRVLNACGYPLTDDRDGIARTQLGLKTLYEIEHAYDAETAVSEGPRRPANRSRRAQPAPSNSYVESSVDLSCIVRSGAFQECRLDHLGQGDQALAARVARRFDGSAVDPAAAAANEGRVHYLNGLATTVEFLGTRPR